MDGGGPGVNNPEDKDNKKGRENQASESHKFLLPGKPFFYRGSQMGLNISTQGYVGHKYERYDYSWKDACDKQRTNRLLGKDGMLEPWIGLDYSFIP